MAQKLIPLAEAAEKLGITPEKLNELRENQEIYGYRDGASWKFKSDDVERLAQSLAAGDDDSEDDEVVLLSEVELGESGIGTSSTIIGRSDQGKSSSESDLRLTESKSMEPDDLKLPTDDEFDDITLESSDDIPLSLDEPGGAEKGGLPLGDDVPLVAEEPSSKIGLGDSGLDLDSGSDADRVLGGSGAGSDITLSPGDSGISIQSPTDSGLSLSDPIGLEPPDDSDFGLDTDDSDFQLSGSSGEELLKTEESDFESDAEMELPSDDEFLLTPLDEAAEDGSEDSGSQVIALDTDTSFDDVGSSSLDQGTSDLLVEDSTQGMPDPLGGAMIEEAPPAFEPATGEAPPAPAAGRETNYGALVMTSLTICVVLLALNGIMLADLVRSIWAWNEPFRLNSVLMDLILGLFT